MVRIWDGRSTYCLPVCQTRKFVCDFIATRADCFIRFAYTYHLMNVANQSLHIAGIEKKRPDYSLELIIPSCSNT